jgi:CRP-like cAMP-binding protein
MKQLIRSGVSVFQTPVTLCILGVGATFGDSILHDLPRDSTVVTRSTCELLRVERQDFKLIWEVSNLQPQVYFW